METIDLLNKLFSIFVSLGILFYSLALKRHTQSWTTPAVLFSLFWFFFTFCPLVIMFTVPVSIWGTLFIASCVFLFGAPTFLTSHKKALAMNLKNKRSVQNIYSGTFISIMFFSMQSSVVICIALNISIQGISIAEFISEPLATAKKYLDLRYSGGIEHNVFAQIGVVLNYTGAALGGLILESKKRKLRILIFSFLPSVLYMVMYADKGTLFLCAAIFYSGIIITRLNHFDTSLTNSKTTRTVIYLTITLLPILIFSFLARSSDTTSTSETIDKLVYYICSYAFAHLYAFSDWLDFYIYGVASQTYAPVTAPTLGFSTFMAIFRLFGDNTVVPDGYYDEYFRYRDIMQSNIYTIYRGLIQDFGIIGSGVYMLLSGSLFNICYIFLLKRRKPVFSVALFICMGGYIYTSFIISIMIWNSIFALFFMLSAILAIDKLIVKSQNGRANIKHFSSTSQSH